MTGRSFVVIVVLLCQSLWVGSQNTLDVFRFAGRYGFPQAYENTYDAKARELGTSLSFTFAVPCSENTLWYNNLNHFYFNVDADPGLPDEELNPVKINGFILRTGLYHKFDPGKGIQLLFVPRLMGDLKNVDSNSMQLGAVFLYERNYHKDLSLSFGAMYNQELSKGGF